MKLMHLSDLHLGKRVNGFSMLEDQTYILRKIISIIDEETPEVILIAGDIYDRSIPPEEAVSLFDDFLVRLAKRKLDVCIISGNHDSEERVSYGGRLMDASGIHPAPVYDGHINPLILEDEFGEVVFWLIPFLKPADVRRFHQDAETGTYTDALGTVIEQLEIDRSKRNIAVSHQFITGASICESEEHTVGGLDDISAEIYADFDYVALGHLHGPQKVGRETVRYAGSPLKYSFSEASQKKSVTMIELGPKGETNIRLIPLEPMRDMKRIRGSFQEIISAVERTEDYCEITLTDEEDIPNAIDRLRVKYPYLMSMKYDNRRTRAQAEITGGSEVEKKTELELFNELYEQQNGQPMSPEQEEYLREVIREIKGEVNI